MLNRFLGSVTAITGNGHAKISAFYNHHYDQGIIMTNLLLGVCSYQIFSK